MSRRPNLQLAAEDGEAKDLAPSAPAPRAIPAIVEFQPDAIELEERAPPRLARMTLYAVVALLVAAVLWASFARLDEVVVAKGKLVTTRPSLVVQPLERSVIREILVQPGDRVTAGQVLARLDPTFVAADSGQVQGKLRALDAQIARLEAELAGQPYIAAPDAGPEAQLQARLYQQRARAYAAKLRDFDGRIGQAQATIASADTEEAVLLKRLQGLYEIDEMHRTLSKSGSGSRLVYLQSRDLSLETEADLGRLRGTRLETVQTLAQARAERESYVEEFRQKTIEQLVSLRQDRITAAEEMKKAALRRDLAVLRAPADAAVLDIAKRSIGSVVQEAEPLFTLVPLNVPLQAEVAVGGQDIGRLTLKDPVRIKFDAFPFQKYGTAAGDVAVISQDAFAPDSREAAAAANGADFYKVRVALGAMSMRGLPQGFTLIPGMGVQAEIKTGRRRVISYFLYPLLRGFDESFHEP